MLTPLSPPSYREILRLAWPAILASAALPLLGIIDTALLCRVGDTSDLGAVALGTFLFNALYWGLSFLRMSTTGFVAQASGASSATLIRITVQRALIVALALGCLVFLVVLPLAGPWVSLLDPEPQVAKTATEYVQARIWGAPATLIGYAVSGALVGQGRMRALLGLQGLTAATNLVANFAFVLGVGGAFAGARGIGAGTACGDWLAAVFGLWLIRKDGLSGGSGPLDWQALLDRGALRHLFEVNAELFLRTLALLSGFFWFSRQGAQFGGTVLAANHILQQFISVSAFFLDGVAFVAESFVGRAVGARNVLLFRLSLRRTFVTALAFGAGLAAFVLFFGETLISLLSPELEVAKIALTNVPFAAAYILIGVPAWQLDGVFIGAGVATALRRAALASVMVFLGCAMWLCARYGNAGLWSAMLIFMATRGLTLALSLPAIWRLFANPSALGRTEPQNV